MSENGSEQETAAAEGATPYEAPVVEDLETPDGPAVTAAGTSTSATPTPGPG
jgi:hypothetical protein